MKQLTQEAMRQYNGGEKASLRCPICGYEVSWAYSGALGEVFANNLVASLMSIHLAYENKKIREELALRK